jgi:nucleoside-diphosphate kinase
MIDGCFLCFPPFPVDRSWVTELSSGTAVALLLTGDAAVERLRDSCGPYVPEIAKHLRPDSVRAQFGSDSTRNAVHCTDLSLDGPLECKFVFHVL